MNEERTGKCLQQVEHIHGHLWQIFRNGQPSHGGDRKIVMISKWVEPCLVQILGNQTEQN
jgi:hypothetical protein